LTPKAEVHRQPLPDWGPVDLAARLGPAPFALLDGLRVAGRRCALVAWAPAERFPTLEAALRIPSPGGEAPAALFAAVGSLDWDGAAHLWHPGAACLFDPEAGVIWWRGSLPAGIQRTGPAPAPAAVAPAAPAWPYPAYRAAVEAARERMATGEIEKVILSVPFSAPCADDPLTVYRRLTAAAPAGLRFLLAGDPERGGALLGVSPEPLVLLEGRRAAMHLLAGTRPAPSGVEADAEAALVADLTANPKDRAEHAVAVELARQDLLEVCEPLTVAVDRFMAVERHPGLLHLASDLSGTLRPEAGPADLVRACFPAGTVGGVPRRPAVALIDRLEPTPRAWYAGAVGAVLPGGDLQLWLTIRSLFLGGGTGLVRTGAGLVYASRPELEWRECAGKARAALAALGAELPPEVMAVEP